MSEPAALSAPKHACAPSWSQLIRFGLSGALNTLFGYVLFLALLTFGFRSTSALVIGTIAGIAFNFQTSRRLVFQSNEPGLLMRFTFVYLVLFAINWTALNPLKCAGLQDWSAQGLLIFPMAALSFVAQRALVFRQR